MLEPGGELVEEVVIPSSGSGEHVLLIPASTAAVFPPPAVPAVPPQPLPSQSSAPKAAKSRRFYCQECNRDFTNQYGLSNHYTKTHKTDRDPRYIRKINHQRHRKAAYLSPQMLHAHPCGTQWTVPAETDPNQQYQINMIAGPDDCHCTITCNYIDCKVCLCRYICSCAEWPADDIPCQHIHFVHMQSRDLPLSAEALSRLRGLGPVARTKEERALLKERFYPGSTARQKRGRASRPASDSGGSSPRKARRTRPPPAVAPASSVTATSAATAAAASAWTLPAGLVYEEEDDGRYYMEDELWAFEQKMQRLSGLVQALGDPQNVARVSQRLETDLIPFVHSLEPSLPRLLQSPPQPQPAQPPAQPEHHLLLQPAPNAASQPHATTATLHHQPQQQHHMIIMH